MRYFFTSDTHFGHKNILKYTNRPFKSVEEMDEELIRRWNATVTPDDTVIHLGDFSLKGNVNKYLKQLNGNIIWIKGNHDNKPIIQDMVIEYGGHHWHLAHDPKDCEGEFNLCGHVHTLWKFKKEKGKTFINVGVDQWDFQPITIKQILEAIE